MARTDFTMVQCKNGFYVKAPIRYDRRSFIVGQTEYMAMLAAFEQSETDIVISIEKLNDGKFKFDTALFRHC